MDAMATISPKMAASLAQIDNRPADLQAVAEQLGLDAETAQRLTQQTALGAARMAIESEDDVAELRRKVTSPNGTTEAAIQSFENSQLRETVELALTAAFLRSQALAKELA